ncbi:MAG: ABC transporter permease [Anaerolineales bacterium]|nr:ABC transporter permease [Anaerolineales bacterium]
MSLDVVLSSIFSVAFIATIIRIATPLLLPALGGLISDLGGVINIALEGQMLIAAFTGVVVSAYLPQWFPGWPVWSYALLSGLAGILAALALSWLIAFFHLELRTDIILTGLAINILAAGVTVFILFVLTGDKGSTSQLASLAIPNLFIPFVNTIPLLGTLLNGANGDGYNLLSYAAILLVPVVSLFLYKTRAGIHLRAAGENGPAAGAAGINTRRTQYLALYLSGILAALGGLYLSMGYLTIFQANMTAGRGFIALAIVNLGNRKPLGVLIAALVFGAATALGAQLGTLDVPPQLIEMIPPTITIVALVIYQARRKAKIAANARRFQVESN